MDEKVGACEPLRTAVAAAARAGRDSGCVSTCCFTERRPKFEGKPFVRLPVEALLDGSDGDLVGAADAVGQPADLGRDHSSDLACSPSRTAAGISSARGAAAVLDLGLIAIAPVAGQAAASAGPA